MLESLKEEYQRLWDAAVIPESCRGHVASRAARATAFRIRYEHVARTLGMPWQVVAAIAELESGQRFDRHLHNGDALSARTIHVPTGRPASGEPPFTWEVSAIDALMMGRAYKVVSWSIPEALHFLEGYNGWGYRDYHPQVLSPYLWSMTNLYIHGKYVSDGIWSDAAISAQVGAVAMLRALGWTGGAVSYPSDELAWTGAGPVQETPIKDREKEAIVANETKPSSTLVTWILDRVDLTHVGRIAWRFALGKINEWVDAEIARIDAEDTAAKK